MAKDKDKSKDKGKGKATGEALKEAKESLERAEKQLAKAEADPDDEDNVFLWSFYALENAVAAAATYEKVQFVKQHWAKGKAAKKLASDIGLPDVEQLLIDLNEARKSTTYGDTEDPELDASETLEAVKEYVKKVGDLVKE